MRSAKKKRALIMGISGQDGGYLAELLLDKGYEVHGTSRDRETNHFYGLQKLGHPDRISLYSAAPTDFRSLISALHKIMPDEIYNLSGQSSVGLSFQQPVETFESIAVSTINILECIRLLGGPIRFFNAASSECFGNTETPANDRRGCAKRYGHGRPGRQHCHGQCSGRAGFWLLSGRADGAAGRNARARAVT